MRKKENVAALREIEQVVSEAFAKIQHHRQTVPNINSIMNIACSALSEVQAIAGLALLDEEK